MRIYVAGKFSEWRRVREVQSALVAAGHSISYDWTQQAGHEAVYGRYAPSELPAFAHKDVNGVLTADVLVLLPHAESRGAFVELGLALGKIITNHDYEKRIIAIGGEAERATCVFLYLPQVVWASDVDEVVALLGRMEVGASEAAS